MCRNSRINRYYLLFSGNKETVIVQRLNGLQKSLSSNKILICLQQFIRIKLALKLYLNIFHRLINA